MKNRKVGAASMVMLFLNLSLAKYLLVVPSFMVDRVGNSAYIVLILKGLGASVLFAAAAALYKPHTQTGLGELSRQSFGKFFGGIVNALAAAVMLVRGAFLFRTLAEALRALEAENAVMEYMALFILVPVLVCALKGFNANVNMSVLILPFTLVSVALIALALTPHFRIENLTPVLGEGAEEILKTAFLQLGGMFEIIYIFIFSRYAAGYKEFRRGGLIGICAVSLIAAVFTLMYCLVIPYPASKEFFFPLYQLTRMIKAGSFMQRMEPVVIFIWAGIVICSLTTVVIGVCELLKSAAGERDRNGFVPIVIMILFFAGALPRSELRSYELYQGAMDFSHWFYVAYLFAVLIAAKIRRIGGREKE